VGKRLKIATNVIFLLTGKREAKMFHLVNMSLSKQIRIMVSLLLRRKCRRNYLNMIISLLLFL